MQIQNILNYLEASVASCPEKAAFEDLEHSFTFAQVLANHRYRCLWRRKRGR